MKKRGQLILYNALELVAAVFATFLIISTAVNWTSGESINQIYYSRDLALLVDTLFIPDGTVHLAYEDNLSAYNVQFTNFSVIVSKDTQDDIIREFPYALDTRYGLDVSLENPGRIFFAKTPRSLVIAAEEQKYSKQAQYEDIDVKDEKSIVISPKSEDLARFTEEKIYSLLEDLLPGFKVSYSKELIPTAPLQLIIGKASREDVINIVYPKSPDHELEKKTDKITSMIHKRLFSKGIKTYLMLSNIKIQESDNVAILIELGGQWEENPSEIVVAVSNAIEEYFKER